MIENPSPRFVFVLLAVTLFAVFFQLQRMDVVSDNEGQRATPPAEMVRSGNYLVPTINGEIYLAKPPLLYWAIAGVYQASGRISPLTARIPTALCGIALVMCVYLLLRREAGEAPARWAAFAVLTAPYALDRMRWAELDIPLTLATFLCVLTLRKACQARTAGRTWAFICASGLALGAATLLKGPVPFLFAGAAWIALLIVEGAFPNHVLRLGAIWSVAALALAFASMILPFHFPVALVVFLAAWAAPAWVYGGPRRLRSLLVLLGVGLIGGAVAAPWALAVIHRVGWDNIRALLNNQVVERTYSASRINSGGPLYYLVALPVMLAPWGLLLPLHASRQDWRERSNLFRFAWLASWLSIGVFSMIAGKEYEYILPTVPWLLLVTGYHLSELQGRVLQRWVAAWLRCLPVVFPLAATLAAVAITRSHSNPVLWLNVWLIAFAMVLSLLYRRTDRSLYLSKIAFMALMAVIVWQLNMNFRYTGLRSPQMVAQVCRSLIEEGYTVEATKVYPAFSFYVGTKVGVEQDPEAVCRKLAGPDPYYYLTRTELVAAMAASKERPAFQVLTKPCTNKKLVLIGNRPLPSHPASAPTHAVL